jgi:hypothetical protein
METPIYSEVVAALGSPNSFVMPDGPTGKLSASKQRHITRVQNAILRKACEKEVQDAAG